MEGQGVLRTVNQPETTTASVALPSNDLKELKETMVRMQKTLEMLSRQNRPTVPSNNSSGQNQNQNKSGFVPRPGSSQPNVRRKCYSCGSEKHLIRDCPKNKDKAPQDKTDSDKKGKVNMSSFQGSGLYITGKISGFEVDCLIDTGATLSVLSTRAWNMVEEQVPNFKKFDKEIISASGNPLNVKGSTTVSLKLGWLVGCVEA